MNTSNPYGISSNSDSPIPGTDTNAQSVAQRAESGLEHVADSANRMQERTASTLGRLAEQVDSAARRSADAVREGVVPIRDRAMQMSDQTVRYIKDEPVKSMLISAAVGATLMALLHLLTRSDRH